MVEKANHTAAQRWWRNLPDDITIQVAQAALDAMCATRFDQRVKVIDELRASVAVHAGRERLRAVPPVPFPATITVGRKVTANARVAFRGNHYSVPPELAHGAVIVTARLDHPTIDIATTAGIVIARHRLAAEGTGAVVADHGHVTALNTAALAAFSDAAPHRSKQRIPPGPAALAAAAHLIGPPPEPGQVIDLAPYAEAANRRNTLT